MSDQDQQQQPEKPTLMDDQTGKPSTMRFLSILFGLAAVGLAASEAALLWHVTTNQVAPAPGAGPGNYQLILYFLGAAIVGKSSQKWLELVKGKSL